MTVTTAGLRAKHTRILKIQASLTAHWHDKGADWRGLAHTQAHKKRLHLYRLRWWPDAPPRGRRGGSGPGGWGSRLQGSHLNLSQTQRTAAKAAAIGTEVDQHGVSFSVRDAALDESCARARAPHNQHCKEASRLHAVLRKRRPRRPSK